MLSGIDQASYAQPLSHPSYAAQANQLAARMVELPSLKYYGLSLQGDLQKAQGDTAAATVAYKRASIRPTPSVRSRLMSLNPEPPVGRYQMNAQETRVVVTESKTYVGPAGRPMSSVQVPSTKQKPERKC